LREQIFSQKFTQVSTGSRDPKISKTFFISRIEPGPQIQKDDLIMLDINKATTTLFDPEGHMFGLAHWLPLFAKHRAETEGIFLTNKHWAVINYLRDPYRDHGDAKSAREIMRDLEERFTDGHGRGILYQLFPGGPASQASRIAGLPLPPYSSDPSFCLCRF
jgi:TusE/DsrC/DsvC family sulfur relay protein